MIVDDREGRAGRLATIALWLPAAPLAELAIAEPGEPIWGGLVRGLVWFMFALLCYLIISRPAIDGRISADSLIVPAALVGIFTLSFLISGLRAAAGIRSEPLEILLITAMRNLGLGLMALGGRRAFARLAALLSLFLVLVASCQAEGAAVWMLVALYAIAGTLWLSMGHWRGFRFGRGSRGNRRRQAAEMLAAVALIGLLVAIAAVGPSRAATALAGLVPSSGGTGSSDPDARSGVGDGENEVKASERPESVGFTDSDVYLDTDRPSLFDTFNDMYGEPVRPKMQKMVALANDKITEQRERPSENLRGGRQFSAVRKRPGAAGRRPGDLLTKALLYVKGPTPLHIGLAAFDEFDGREWREGYGSRLPIPLTQESAGGDWFRIDRTFGERLFAGSSTHQIRIAALDSPNLPLPAHPVRVRIGGMNRGDFYAWSHEGMLRLDGRSAPAGTVLDVESSSLDGRRLREQSFMPAPDEPGGYRAAAEVEAQAKAWTVGVPRGWDQVDAVVSRLRGYATVDPSSPAPEGCADAVSDFLIRSRRGPDYLFASSSAVLLRSLGYSTRLVTGLYAAPGRYDPRRRQTPVLAEDVHVWAEVRLPCGLWATIEPTPGYVIAGASPTWREWASARLSAAWSAAKSHRLMLLGFGVFLAVLARFRREVRDSLMTFAWRVAPASDPRQSAISALRLVERRAGLAGFRRPSSKTPIRWFSTLEPADGAGDLSGLLDLADWALYAPPDVDAPADHREAGRRAVAAWTLRRFQAVARSVRNREEIAA